MRVCDDRRGQGGATKSLLIDSKLTRTRSVTEKSILTTTLSRIGSAVMTQIFCVTSRGREFSSRKSVLCSHGVEQKCDVYVCVIVQPHARSDVTCDCSAMLCVVVDDSSDSRFK